MYLFGINGLMLPLYKEKGGREREGGRERGGKERGGERRGEREREREGRVKVRIRPSDGQILLSAQWPALRLLFPPLLGC